MRPFPGTDINRVYWQSVFCYGWPCLALDLELQSVIHRPLWRRDTTVAAGALSLSFWRTNKVHPFVPLRPIWPGFAINTLFYAGVLWVLFCGPFALRRMIRRRRGRCTHCAYPIGQSLVCTECGAAVIQTRVAAAK